MIMVLFKNTNGVYKAPMSLHKYSDDHFSRVHKYWNAKGDPKMTTNFVLAFNIFDDFMSFRKTPYTNRHKDHTRMRQGMDGNMYDFFHDMPL
jgi:hypothetical protein